MIALAAQNDPQSLGAIINNDNQLQKLSEMSNDQAVNVVLKRLNVLAKMYNPPKPKKPNPGKRELLMGGDMYYAGELPGQSYKQLIKEQNKILTGLKKSKTQRDYEQALKIAE